MANCRRNSLAAAALIGVLSSTNAMALESGFYLGLVGGQGTADVEKRDYDRFERVPSALSFSSSLDDSDTAVGIVLGGQFGRWIGVEAQLMDLGELSYSSNQTVLAYSTNPRNVDIRSKTTVEAAVGTLSGIFTVPIGEHVAIGFRLGFAVNATDTNYDYEERRGNTVIYRESGGNDADASDVGATYGISVEFAPVQHLGLRLDYQIIKNVGGEDDDYDFEYYDDDFYYDDVPEQDGRDVGLLSLSMFWRF